MKKLLYFIHLPPPVHGAAKANEIVFTSKVVNLNFEKRLLSIKYNSDLSSINGFSVKKIFIYLKLFFKFVQELIFFKPNLIYYSIPPTGIGLYKEIPFISLLKLFKVETLYHLHGRGIEENVKGSRFKKIIHKWIYSNSNIIHLSENLMINEIKKLDIKNSNLFVVNNGIEKKPELSSINRYKEKEVVKILFLSNLFLSKGILMALDIIHELKKDYYDIQLHVVGSFPDISTKDIIESKTKNLGVKESVTFHGPLYNKDKFDLMSEMDFLLYPSFNDAFPLVILECLQVGLPIIGSDQGAIPEIVTNEIGFIFKTGNLKEATEACKKIIARLLDEPELIKSKCKQYFEQKYTSEIFQNNIKEVFNKILN